MDKNILTKLIKNLIIALIIAIALKVLFIDFIQVDGKSMFNTLKDGEKLLLNKVVYKLREPQKGEIIIFEYPLDKKDQMIKRVIAIEGDTIEIIQGKVIVNGVKLSEDYIREETLENLGRKAVPKNTIFVLGDNRNNSKDSRFEDIGFIPQKLIKGKAMYVIWPFENIRKIR